LVLITSIAALAALYPFFDGSFASSVGSASPAYFGNFNPLPWEFSFPLKSIRFD